MKKIFWRSLGYTGEFLKKHSLGAVMIASVLAAVFISIFEKAVPCYKLCIGITLKTGDIFEYVFTFAAVVVVYAEIKQNKQISEAQLVKDLNCEFINDECLSMIEHKLEIYYSQYMNAENDDEKKEIKLDLNLSTESYQRQYLVNYLVHLEAIASLVNANILRLNVINELVAYRFFIALNNPIIQEVELKPYKEYYMGCYKLHKRWTKSMHRLEKRLKRESGDNKTYKMIPMEEYGEFFDDNESAKNKKAKKNNTGSC